MTWSLRCAGVLILTMTLWASAHAQDSPEPVMNEDALIEFSLLDRLPDRYVNLEGTFIEAETRRLATFGFTLSDPEAHKLFAVHFDGGVQWNQSVVTVAFNGGNEQTWRLIEQTAREWTQHSSNYFSFQFRDANNAFLRWRTTDTAPAADIRIAFLDTQEAGGNWSLIGRMATTAPANLATMNYQNFPDKLRRYYNGQNTAEWRASYEHRTILHEFGHALGLSHEHFHPECQSDLILRSEPGYVRTLDRRGEYYIPDAQGRSPGAILFHQSPRLGWTEAQATFNLDADEYFRKTTSEIARALGAQPTTKFTPHIDRRSVMLYTLYPFVLRARGASVCLADVNPPQRWVTELSQSDVEYFQSFYNRPLPPRAPQVTINR